MAVNGKTTSAPSPLMKNAATAPVIYFDGCPVHGTLAGNIEVELAARVLMPKADGSVIADMVCTAHLRCSAQAAQSLVDALSHALAMHGASPKAADQEPTRLNS